MVGTVIYAFGSALTAASWSVPTLMLGWSILEGIGAALVLPALVALVAGNFSGKDRAIAYGVLGGVAGAGIAVGPILGGWMTTDYSWRYVFVGEVVVAAGILIGTRLIREPEREGPRPLARLGRQHPLGQRPGADRHRGAPGEQLGMALPAQFARRAVRLLADPVRDRGRRRRPRRLPLLAAAPGGARSSTRWCTSGSSASRRCAAGSGCSSPRT